MSLDGAVLFTAVLAVFLGWCASACRETEGAWKLWLMLFVVTVGLTWFLYFISGMAAQH